MSQLLTLEQTSKLIKFPSAVSYHLGHKTGFESDDFDGSADSGIVSQDGSIAALAKGSSLDIVFLETNERLSAWTFSTQSEAEPEISALLTFREDRSSARPSHVVVGLSCGLDGGLVCLFDIPTSKIIRCLSIPYPVTSLALVSEAGGPSCAGYLHPSLRYLHGVLAVGMTEGRLYLVDFALDESFLSTDSNPAGVVFIDPMSRDLPRHRREALSKGNHVAIDLSCDVRGQVFVWEQAPFGPASSPSNRKEFQFPVEEVHVSCLHYTPFNAGLAVGYNLGTWRLISLQTLQIDHSSMYSTSLKPVTHISFQEPENDPRNYVYYWIVRSEREDDADGIAVAMLYSLTYRQKQIEFVGEEECPLYTDLESLVVRFEHVLGGEDEPNVSWCIGMYTLQLQSGHVNQDSSETEHGKDYGLNVILWKAGTKPSTAATYLGVFDINAWYQAQMPSSFSVDESDDLCSYFSHSLLEDPAGGSGGILDVTVFRDSVTRFSGASQVLEQHCYPSSLKFDLVVLTRDGYLEASHLGIQRRVLSELACSSTSLVQPSQLYQLCLMAGLAQGSMLEPSLLSQRELLLNIALEYNMVGLIVAAVRDWADGKYSKAGCTLKFMLDWAWKRVAVIKDRLDLHTVPLFDFSLVEADDSIRQLLSQLSGQLSQLVSILSGISAAAGIVTQIGLEQLDCRQNVTGLVLLYTQAVTWFVNMGLLPEQPEGRNNPYPIGFLTDCYRDRRRKMGTLPRTYGKPNLLVDLLCEDIGDDLIRNFQKSGGAGDYPPPSLHALLSIFLSDSPAPAKLRLVQYLFLDLAQILEPELWSELVDNLIKFPSAFSLPPSIIKLTQAFWLLDHEDWEESIGMMLDPLLQEDDLQPHHHRAILTALLAQGQHALALKYSRIRRPPILEPADVQLQISVLLQNGAIQEAYIFQRTRQSSSGSSELLQQFYQRAEELHKLDSVLKLSLSKQEETQLVRFLQDSKKPHSQEVLLMYYLQRSRYTDAMQLNEKLKTMGGGQKAAAREAIMERYSSILPSLGRGYTTLPPKKGAQQRSRPEPVRVVPTDMNMSLASRARELEDALNTPTQALPSQTPFRNKGAKRIHLGLLGGEKTEPVKRKISEFPTLSYPTNSSVFEDSIDTTRNELVSPPNKRTRMSDIGALTMSTKSARRLSRMMTADALTILQTPTIVKKSVPRTRTPLDKSEGPHTPHSILKVKKLIQENSPALDVETSPSECFLGGPRVSTTSRVSATSRVSTTSREGTPSKSLRFQVPKKLPPLDASEYMPSGEAQTTIFSPSLVSPRAELATSSDREISFQVPANRVDQRTFRNMKVRSISEGSKASSDDSYHSLSESPRANLSPALRARVNAVEEQAEARLRQSLAKIVQPEVLEKSLRNPDDTQEDVVEEDDCMDQAIDNKVDNEEEDDAVSVQVVDEDEEEEVDSDDAYYENRTFERKECSIILEDYSYEEEEDTPAKPDVSWEVNPNQMGDKTMNEFIQQLVDETPAKPAPPPRPHSYLPDWAWDALNQTTKEDEVEEVAVEPEESMVLSPDDTAAPINPLSATLRFSVSSDEPSILDPEPEPHVVVQTAPLDFSELMRSSTEEEEEEEEDVRRPKEKRILARVQAEERLAELEQIFDDIENDVSVSVEQPLKEAEQPLEPAQKPLEDTEKPLHLSQLEDQAMEELKETYEKRSPNKISVQRVEAGNMEYAEKSKRPGSSLSFSYDTVTTDTEKECGTQRTGFLLDIPEQDETFEILSQDEIEAIREDEPYPQVQAPQDQKYDDIPEEKEGGGEDNMRALLARKEAEVEAQEIQANKKDEMRDLLDCVSTTATRASSVCGSMWSESVQDTSFSFADAEVISQQPLEAIVDVDQVFEIREPIDTSQVEDMEVDEKEDLPASAAPSPAKEFQFETPAKPFQFEDEAEYSDDSEATPAKLEFSWTKLTPPAQTTEQVLQELASQEITFSEPILENANIETKAQAETFNFANPLDVSMDLGDDIADISLPPPPPSADATLPPSPPFEFPPPPPSSDLEFPSPPPPSELELPPSDSEEESPSKPAQEIEPIVEPDIDELLGDTDDDDDRSYRRTGDSRYSVAPDSSQYEPEPPMDDEPEPQMEAESEPRMEAEQTSSEPEPKQTELEPERSIEKVSEEPIVHEIKETEITVEEFTDKSTKAVSKEKLIDTNRIQKVLTDRAEIGEQEILAENAEILEEEALDEKDVSKVNLEVDEQMEEVVENVAEHVGMDVAEEKTDQVDLDSSASRQNSVPEITPEARKSNTRLSRQQIQQRIQQISDNTADIISAITASTAEIVGARRGRKSTTPVVKDIASTRLRRVSGSAASTTPATPTGARRNRSMAVPVLDVPEHDASSTRRRASRSEPADQTDSSPAPRSTRKSSKVDDDSSPAPWSTRKLSKVDEDSSPAPRSTRKSSKVDDDSSPAPRSTRKLSKVDDDSSPAPRSTRKSSKVDDDSSPAPRSTRKSSNVDDDSSPAPRSTRKSSKVDDDSSPAPRSARKSSKTVDSAISPSVPLSAKRGRPAKHATPQKEFESHETPQRRARGGSTPKTPLETPGKTPKKTPAKSVKKMQMLDEEASLTPTRRSRRVSGSAVLESEPLTPSRRSTRRSSLAVLTALTPQAAAVTAPDGGIITGSAARRGSGTPRSARRHTSVKKEDVDVALGLTPVALEAVLEDIEQEDDVEEQEEHLEPQIKPKGRPGRRSTLNVTSLDAIQEEPGSSRSSISKTPEASVSAATKGTKKNARQASLDAEAGSSSTPEVGRRELRRRTIITLADGEGLLYSPVAQEEGVESLEKILADRKKGYNEKKYFAKPKKKRSARL